VENALIRRDSVEKERNHKEELARVQRENAERLARVERDNVERFARIERDDEERFARILRQQEESRREQARPKSRHSLQFGAEQAPAVHPNDPEILATELDNSDDDPDFLTDDEIAAEQPHPAIAAIRPLPVFHIIPPNISNQEQDSDEELNADASHPAVPPIPSDNDQSDRVDEDFAEESDAEPAQPAVATIPPSNDEMMRTKRLRKKRLRKKN